MDTEEAKNQFLIVGRCWYGEKVLEIIRVLNLAEAPFLSVLWQLHPTHECSTSLVGMPPWPMQYGGQLGRWIRGQMWALGRWVGRWVCRWVKRQVGGSGGQESWWVGKNSRPVKYVSGQVCVGIFMCIELIHSVISGAVALLGLTQRQYQQAGPRSIIRLLQSARCRSILRRNHFIARNLDLQSIYKKHLGRDEQMLLL